MSPKDICGSHAWTLRIYAIRSNKPLSTRIFQFLIVLLVKAVGDLFLFVTSEAMTFKVLSCFNFNPAYNIMVYARGGLIILLVLATISLHIIGVSLWRLIQFKDRDFTVKTVGIVSLVPLLVVLILNMILLATLKSPLSVQDYPSQKNILYANGPHSKWKFYSKRGHI